MSEHCSRYLAKTEITEIHVANTDTYISVLPKYTGLPIYPSNPIRGLGLSRTIFACSTVVYYCGYVVGFQMPWWVESSTWEIV